MQDDDDQTDLDISYETALDVFRRFISGFAIFPIGLASIDDLLNGGFYASELTELVGGAACGKTQMCLTAIARLLLVLDDSSSQVENCAGGVFYVDSNGSFRSSRLLQIMAALRPDADVKLLEKHLDRVFVRRASDEPSLDAALTQATILCEKGQVSLIIVDSIDGCLSDSALQYADGGKDVLESVSRRLRELAIGWGCAVVLVNHFTNWRTGAPEPALGQLWKTAPDVRLELMRSDEALANASLECECDPISYARLVLSPRRTCDARLIPFRFGVCGVEDA